LNETEERSRQMQQSATLQFASVSTDFQRRFTRQQERLDSFVEYPSPRYYSTISRPERSAGFARPECAE
jgi:hypothetical protein